ncbi:single-stranded-DNA-specific exonuclease RecJ [Zhengella mangrovi]|uniref:Single-stranded-DNA-specific exonuclease RecJ n=1 Tax=Zhengella mangrovi TaxID=1982044 RepID=A0A2G1QR59_9HYPH|nr:single-stranded-DNA-specific exonuclease RecJ [Zhengella mangrovi]PHP67944.1 single-stranded-DNA-specific exonuclease RecJ [Zhengella mangrovi]
MDKTYFLNVRQSASGMAWRSRLGPAEENVALAMAQTHGIDDLVARVMAGRGVLLQDAERFLQPTIRDLMPDPSSLTAMDAAAERIAAAIVNGERVAIFGDYDVDGAVSSALMSRYLNHFGVPHEIYIPDRIFEGYGPNPAAMRDLRGRGAGLIVTVDCGSNSAEAIAAAVGAGADVVVLDHHQMLAEPPAGATAVVNPNRDDDLSGQGHLCAAGVVFLALVRVSSLIRARRGKPPPDLLGMLDLVAMATVCDVVPLKGVNRAFVTKGVQVARSLHTPGMAALAAVARIGEPIAPWHFGFALGPRINAGGRIGDAALGSRLLASDDPGETREIAGRLDALNQERQAMEQAMLADARAQAEAEMLHGAGPAVLVTESTDWHPGIAGLIASRLKDFARRPAFAIAFDVNGRGTGSGRSIPGFDLGRLVGEAVREGLLVKGGGHAMAAGITVERARLGDLRAFFEERSRAAVDQLVATQSLKIDAALTADGATVKLMDLLEQAGPYGAGHAQPVFAMPRHTVTAVQPVGNAGAHLRVSLQSQTGRRIDAMAFRAADTDLGRFLAASRGRMIHTAGTLGLNHWNGQVRVQYRLLDAAEIG